MNSKELINCLRHNKINPVNIVWGTEQYLIHQVKDAYINIISDEERDFNISQYDMENVSLSTVLDDAMSPPFFGDYRVVFITNPYFLTSDGGKLKHDLSGLINYIQNPTESTVLVMLAPYPKLDKRKKIVKLLEKYGNMINCSPMSEKAIRDEVLQVLDQRKIKIESCALQLLLERSGFKVENVMNELKKLIISVEETKNIKLKDVEQLVSSSFEQNVFNLVDLVMDHDNSKALKMYHELVNQQEEPLKINAILLGNFRLLLQVKILFEHGYSQGNIAEELKVHPYRVKLALRKIQKFTFNDLQRAYLGLFENELKIKSTSQDHEMLFQLFLLTFNRKHV